MRARVLVLCGCVLAWVGVAHAAPDAGVPAASVGDAGVTALAVPRMPADADPDAPTIVLRPGKSKVLVAEPFIIKISVLHLPDMKIDLPAALPLDAQVWAEIDRKQSASQEKDGRVVTTFDITVAALTAGSQTFPALPFGYTKRGEHRVVMSQTVTVDVKATIKDADADKAELKPTAAPVDVMVRDWTLLWVLGGVVAAAVFITLGVWLGRRFRARARGELSSLVGGARVPPDEAALFRLRALRNSPALDEEDRRVFYGELTESVRQFLEARTGAKATSATTVELVASLGARVDREHAGRLTQLLVEADLVKFARAASTRDQALVDLDTAIACCEGLRPAETMAAATGTDAGMATGTDAGTDAATATGTDAATAKDPEPPQ